MNIPKFEDWKTTQAEIREEEEPSAARVSWRIGEILREAANSGNRYFCKAIIGIDDTNADVTEVLRLFKEAGWYVERHGDWFVVYFKKPNFFTRLLSILP